MHSISRLRFGPGRVSIKMAYSRVAAMVAILLLGVALADTTSPTLKQRAVTMVTGDPKRTVPVSQLVSSMYPQRIAGRHQTAVPDPAMVLDLVMAQQRWRRVDKAKGLLVSEPHPCAAVSQSWLAALCMMTLSGSLWVAVHVYSAHQWVPL